MSNSAESTVKSQRASNHNLISPPPEFSNKKLIESQDHYATTLNGTPYLTTQKLSSTTTTANSDIVKSPNQSFTPTSSYEEIRIPSRSSSREVTLRHQSYQTTPRSRSSLSSSNYHPLDIQPRSSSVIRAASYTPSNYTGASSQQLRTVDNYHYNTIQNGSSSRSQSTSYRDGRESVRSPLTLSMDSGISSSGIATSKSQKINLVF